MPLLMLMIAADIAASARRHRHGRYAMPPLRWLRFIFFHAATHVVIVAIMLDYAIYAIIAIAGYRVDGHT